MGLLKAQRQGFGDLDRILEICQEFLNPNDFGEAHQVASTART